MKVATRNSLPTRGYLAVVIPHPWGRHETVGSWFLAAFHLAVVIPARNF
jgi:hypothetical protein